MDATSQSYNEPDSPQDSSSASPLGANARGATRRVGLVPILLLVMLCQIALLIWLVRQDPLALYRINSLIHPSPVAPQRP